MGNKKRKRKEIRKKKRREMMKGKIWQTIQINTRCNEKVLRLLRKLMEPK